MPWQTPRVERPPNATAGDGPENAGLVSRDPHNDDQQLSAIAMAVSKLRNVDPLPMAFLENHRQALVVGGGIAGMHASLAIADHGYPVALVEQEETLGGNLAWLNQTIEGHSLAAQLEESIQKVENHPLVEIHSRSTITASFGEVGNFYTTVTDAEGTSRTIQHATVILATGGSEASTQSYGYGDHPAVITQKELESKLGNEKFDTTDLRSVVMIQCVDSREEPRNYCSRVCCPTSLKHALKLKEIDPDIAVYILYRDMMTTGFLESYFTKSREKGIFFIQYDPGNKPGLVMPAALQPPVRIDCRPAAGPSA